MGLAESKTPSDDMERALQSGESVEGAGKSGTEAEAYTARRDESISVVINGKTHRILFDPDTPVNFWGKSIRLGDEIIGDPDSGAISYYPSDGDGNLEAGDSVPHLRPVKLAEVLFRDGVFLNDEGQVIRASHGQRADTLHDRIIEVVPALRDGRVEDPHDLHRARVGQRFVTDDGQDSSVGHVAFLAHSGFDRTGSMVHLSGARRTFKWTFYDHPPVPWSYLMQISGYEANRYAPPRKPPKSGWQAWREANGLSGPGLPDKPQLPPTHPQTKEIPLLYQPERPSESTQDDEDPLSRDRSGLPVSKRR